jgi:anaerobic C4-dicarboxylate transporter DcuA
MIWLELLVVLACIYLGARCGGMSLGTIAAIGLAVLVFVFGLTPGAPPRAVLGMILTVITAAATMQAAGGMDYLVVVSECVLRIWPKGITLAAAFVAYILTFMSGTGNIIYTLLPVIAGVTQQECDRTSISITAIASQQAITASDSTATVALLGLLSEQGSHGADSSDQYSFHFPGMYFGARRGHVEGRELIKTDLPERLAGLVEK